MSRNVILIAIIIVVAAYFYMNSKDKEEQQAIEPESSNQEVSAQVKGPSINLESDDLIENLVKEGIISKIEEDGDTPKVYISEDFYTIPDVDKRAIMEVLYKNFKTNNPAVTHFTMYDAKSGDIVVTWGEKGLQRN
jgi:preprotein translocase subunit YajC